MDLLKYACNTSTHSPQIPAAGLRSATRAKQSARRWRLPIACAGHRQRSVRELVSSNAYSRLLHTFLRNFIGPESTEPRGLSQL